MQSETPTERKFTFLSKLFCNHNYELVNQFEMISEFEIVLSHGKTPNTHCSRTRLLITDYKCTECSKIKRLQAKTPSL